MPRGGQLKRLIVVMLLLLVASPAWAVQHIWVANTGAHTIIDFLVTDTGNVAPQQTITTTGATTPYGIAIDNGGNIWISNQTSAATGVFEYSAAAVAGCGVSCSLSTSQSGGALSGSNTGMGTSGTATAANGIWVDGSGNLFVAQNGTPGKVSEWTSAHALAGGNVAPDLSFNTVGTTARGVTTDGSGNIYVVAGADLEQYNSSGTLQWEIVGATSTLTTPQEVRLDGSNNTWVTDSGVQHTLEWLAGACTSGTSPCNIAPSKTTNGAQAGVAGLSIDGSGNIRNNQTTAVNLFNSSATFVSQITGASTTLSAAVRDAVDPVATPTPTPTPTFTPTPTGTPTPTPGPTPVGGLSCGSFIPCLQYGRPYGPS